ncbi:MAG: hypothetical protein Q9207_004435 [Kuettlingeria erythrocarpa]
MSTPHQALTSKLTSLLDSGEYSDLTIKCSDQEFRVHRMFVLPASKVFTAACRRGFKEAHDGIIDLSDHDLDTVKRVISYLYTADYIDEDHPAAATISSRSHTPLTDDGAPEPTSSSAWVQLPNTKIVTPEPVAAAHLRGIAPPPVSLSEKVSLSALLNNVLFDEEIVTVLREVYAATPANDTLLRNAVHAVCDRYADELIFHDEFLKVVKEDGTLACNMLHYVYDAKIKHHMEYLQKEKEWRSALQSRDDQIKSAKEWAKVELESVKDLLRNNLKCRDCKEPLILKMKRGRAAQQKIVELACARCGSVEMCKKRDLERDCGTCG